MAGDCTDTDGIDVQEDLVADFITLDFGDRDGTLVIIIEVDDEAAERKAGLEYAFRDEAPGERDIANFIETRAYRAIRAVDAATDPDTPTVVAVETGYDLRETPGAPR